MKVKNNISSVVKLNLKCVGLVSVLCLLSLLIAHMLWFGLVLALLYLATSYILIYLGFVMIDILNVHHHHDANILVMGDLMKKRNQSWMEVP